MTPELIKEAALSPCKMFDVKRMDVFGSTTRGASGPSSDIDLLVEFNDPARDPAKRFFGLLHALEDALGRPVDLLTASGLRNPYFRQRVLLERVLIYGE